MRTKPPYEIWLRDLPHLQQAQTINGHIEEYRTAAIGIGRILSVLYVKKIYRKTFVKPFISKSVGSRVSQGI